LDRGNPKDSLAREERARLSDEKVKQSTGPREEGAPSAAEALLAQEKKKGEELLMKLKYLQADFENYRKRTVKEMREVEDASVRNLVLKLLSVLDELGLAIQNAKPDEGGELLEGIRMVHKNLNAALESEGLRRISAVGEPFDPSLHEAVEKVEGSSQGDDVVVGEIRTGYTFRGQVIRPSMVKVELALKAAKVGGG
jgi:molecular chaperone GrpE